MIANAKTYHGTVLLRAVGSLHPSPENDDVYRPTNLTDPDFRDLVASVEADGVREAILVTEDDFVISGHRRLAAAKAAGLAMVPVRVADYRRADDLHRFLRDLREHNRQRVKTRGERVREAIIDLDAEDCHRELSAFRAESARTRTPKMKVGQPRCRARISKAKLPFLHAIQRVIRDRADYWPLSDRGIHYALLNDPPLIHAGKPGSSYANDTESYRALTRLLTVARLAGEISFEAIHDPTRPVTVWQTWQESGAYVKHVMHGLFHDYWRDLMQSQPNHVELFCEKNTVEPIVRKVAAEFTIPLTSGRGYASLPPRAEMAQRYADSGKEHLIIVFVTDLDPEGESIAESFARSLRDDFGVRRVQPVKAALTREQVRRFRLRKLAVAKAGSTRRAGYVAEHGEHVWELEALPPDKLQAIVRATVESVIDVAAFNAECDAEQVDALHLEALRRHAIEAFGDMEDD